MRISDNFVRNDFEIQNFYVDLCVTTSEKSELDKKLKVQKSTISEQRNEIFELNKTISEERNKIFELNKTISDSNEKLMQQNLTIFKQLKNISELAKKLKEAEQRRFDHLSFYGGMLFVATITTLLVFGVLTYWKKQKSCSNGPDHNHMDPLSRPSAPTLAALEGL